MYFSGEYLPFGEKMDNIISDFSYLLIYFIYGLAFFCMGLAIIIEGNRSTDERLRLSLSPLAAFGFIHGIHEWMDMFEHSGMNLRSDDWWLIWSGIKIGLLAYSFISLAGFGFSLLNPNLKIRRLALLAPLLLTGIWGFGIFFLSHKYNLSYSNFSIVDVWTRYSLGIPAGITAAIGMVVQQRTFRKAGMARFGRDALVASVAFAWYGLVGQIFTKPSRLWPSTVLNSDLFLFWFNFPIQLLRTILAIIVSISVIRFMQAFDMEIQRQIKSLQEMRMREAERREVLRVELFKRVISAQEAERQRIARELHDETGQTLTAIGLGLRGISSVFSKDPEQALINLSKLEGLTAESIVELQRMISNLRPAHLDDLGLASAIRWYVGKIQKQFDLKFIFSVVGKEFSMPDPLSTAIYRMTQESITNVIKHASASNVTIELKFAEGQIRLTVSDDGKGMEIDKKRDSWGLLGMSERTSLFGGEFVLDSTPGNGVQIRVTIPFNEEEYKLDSVLEAELMMEGITND